MDMQPLDTDTDRKVASPSEAPQAEPSVDAGKLWPNFILPAVVWIALTVGLSGYLSGFMPVFAAVPLGLVLGLVGTGLIVMVAVFENGKSLVEVNITLAIYLVLAAMLVPTFIHARYKAQQKVLAAHRVAAEPVAAHR